MKNIIKGEEPQRLIDYKRDNPEGVWSEYRRSQARRLAVQNQLRKDQGGLCA